MHPALWRPATAHKPHWPGYTVCLHIQVSYPTQLKPCRGLTLEARREPEKPAGKYRQEFGGKDRGALHNVAHFHSTRPSHGVRLAAPNPAFDQTWSTSASRSLALTSRFVVGEKNLGESPSTVRSPLRISLAARAYWSKRAWSPHPFAARAASTTISARVILSRLRCQSADRSIAPRQRAKRSEAVGSFNALRHWAAEASA